MINWTPIQINRMGMSPRFQLVFILMVKNWQVVI